MDKKTRPTHMLPTRDPPQDSRSTQTESKGLKTNFPSKQMGKKARIAIFLSDKIDFKKKMSHNKRPRRSLHNTQGKNTSRIHKHCKYTCTQHRSTQIHKENLGGLQEIY